MSRKMMSLLSILVIAAMVLTACGGRGGGEQAPAEQPAAEATEAPAEATEAPAEATEAPAEATEAPAEATEAPAEATEAPAEATEAQTVTPTIASNLPDGMTEAEAETATRAIEESSRRQTKAMIDGDIATMRELTVPNVTATHISGYVQPREEWYSQIESGYFDYHSVTPHSTEITFTDKNTASVVGRSTVDVTINGSRGTWNLESTATWHRQSDGRWLGGNSKAEMY